MGNGGTWNGGKGAVPVESSASPQCSSDSPERGGNVTFHEKTLRVTLNLSSPLHTIIHGENLGRWW